MVKLRIAHLVSIVLGTIFLSMGATALTGFGVKLERYTSGWREGNCYTEPTVETFIMLSIGIGLLIGAIIGLSSYKRETG